MYLELFWHPKILKLEHLAYQLFITFGIFVAACINIGTRTLGNSGSWRIPIALGIVFATFLGTAILFMPESPRWLETREMHDKARASVFSSSSFHY